MEKSISVLIILIMTTGMVSGDSIYPDKEEYIPTEGSSVTLSCSYETSSEDIYLYWYRHDPNQAPRFLLYKGARSWSSYELIPDKRYKSTTSRTSTELIITSLTLADTALYYCAIWDIWSTEGYEDKLIFGKAINVIVQPNGAPAKPTLSILSPLDRSNGDGPDVCLATGFFPREKNMDLILENNTTDSRRTTKAALSSSRTYFFAGFSKENIKRCEMDGILEARVDDKDVFTDVSKYNTTATTASVICNDEPLNNATATNYTDYAKMNFTSVVVYGLRVLFAKAVAFNVLFTVKALVF